MKSVEEILDDEATIKYEPIKDIWRESNNYDFPSPLILFLDLIGYSKEEWGENLITFDQVQDRLGFHELGSLGEALVVYSDFPQESIELIKELVEADSDIDI